MKAKRINKLSILLLIAAQLPNQERQRILQYARAKNSGVLHAKSIKINQSAYCAHWVSPIYA